MVLRITLYVLSLLTVVCPVSPARAVDMDVYVPSKSNASLYPGKGGASMNTLSGGDLHEINGEFSGLLYMAQDEFSYERWPGRTMSDCQTPNAEGFCQTCELIMGHVSAEYYFYKEEGKQRCTLKQIDAHLAVSDPEMLKTLKRTAQKLFGVAPMRGNKESSRGLGWSGSGPGWKWETVEDLAYLYMDTEDMTASGHGSARFQWRRAPLNRSEN